MNKTNFQYIFTDTELDEIIENYCIPVWEAPNEHEQALAGYVLACILDYVARSKYRNAQT